MTTAVVMSAIPFAGATNVKFYTVRSDGFYVVNKSTLERTELVKASGNVSTVELEPGQYTLWGFHSNDKTQTPLSVDLEVLTPEENGTTDAEIQQSFTITYGMYVIQNDIKINDEWIYLYGGRNFTIENICLFDADGNPVNFTYADRIRISDDESKSDLSASGYYIMGLKNYVTTASFIPDADVFPTLLPTEWSATLGTSANSKSVYFDEAAFLTLKYPESATGDICYKRSETHYVPFGVLEPTNVTTEDGIVTKSYKVGKNSDDYNYRVSREGDITCAGIFQSNRIQNVEVTEEMLTSARPDYYIHNVSTKVGNGTQYSDIFLNINKRGLLRLNTGEQFQIVNLRTWQLTNNSTGNYFIEPDYHWTVLNSDFEPDQSVVKVDEKGKLTAVAPGTAIVLVDYDAIRLSAMDGDLWSKLWAENTGTFVVTVDADETKAPADNIGLDYKPGYDLDAEHDILYYMKDEAGYELTFTPAEGATVSVANPVVDTVNNTVAYPEAFSNRNVKVNEDGSVTVVLTYGRNIIRTTGADGETNFQVLSAKPVTCEVVTPRADGLALPGDEIKFEFDGLFHVAGKLAGIYNSNCHVRFNDISTLAGTVLGNGQYDFAGNQAAQTFTVTVPMDATESVVISKGCLDPEGYGSGPGAHRAVDYEIGMNPNFNAGISSGEYGSIPSQTYPVTPFDKVDRLSVRTKMGKSVIPVRETTLKEVYGENIHWEMEDENVAQINDVWAFCPYHAGVTVANLYADGNGEEGVRTPLLVCDVEVEDVEGYVPVESIRFKHEGDLEFQMNLSWGNWGNQCYLSTEVLPEDATDKIVHLTSSNPDMVTLGKKGNAEYDSNYCGLFWNLSNLPGESVVTARSADGRLAISTTVRFLRYADSINLDESEITLGVGESYSLTATVKPDVCSYPTVWTSSDEEVAVVDDNGNVIATGSGTAVITASTVGRYNAAMTASCAIVVENSTSSIRESEQEILSVYPNPCSDILNVIAANDGRLQVYSLEGALSLEAEIEAGNNSIDVTGLKSGLYIVRFGNNTTKLIKE